MKLIPTYLDFETYWTKDHSLTKMSHIAYVMHPETEVISLSIGVRGDPVYVVFGETAIQKALDELDAEHTFAVAHNMSGFDALIAAWRFNFRPKMWGCTLSMARPEFKKTCGVSLAAMVKRLDIGVKDNSILLSTQGKRLADFTPEEIDRMRIYNRDDTDQCRDLFAQLVRQYTRKELWHIHATTQMLVNPKFELDVDLVTEALAEEQENKARAIMGLRDLLFTEIEQHDAQVQGQDLDEMTRAQMASSAQFAELLASRGVECPTKVSPTNEHKRIYALAKTDQAFLALQEHDDPIVATAALVRLSVKSTLLETRLQAFLDAAKDCGGKLPIPTLYAGADTTGRRSGEVYNPLNLPRIPRDGKGAIIHKTSNALRLSMRAPKGYVVVVADQANIELRVNHVLWKVASTMNLFAQDPEADLYKEFASKRYRVPVSEVVKDQRQMGKVAHLGLGFGAGPPKFKDFAMSQFRLFIEKSESEEVVAAWRYEYSDIVTGWGTCGKAIKGLMSGIEGPIDPWGMVHAELNPRKSDTIDGRLRLPSGRCIYYPNLHTKEDGKWPDGRKKHSIFYGTGRHTARLTGPKTDENIVQALARDINADVMYDIWKLTDFEPAMECYDELVYVVPTSEGDALLAEVHKRMRTPPKWWPELITWSEGDIADCYGEAK